ncbi:hypothetical protein MKW98_013429 [Papaver atlanticum]|uniref:Uncharacterized protein n=1 Tax=Papaver atlanticum TaxID=357466 RepID=A0AAD4SUF7_9MAGN|nr:hypothetical protein MKW98_013429 [Papaver atlanticum]
MDDASKDLEILKVNFSYYTARFDKVSLDKFIGRVADIPDPQLDPAVKEAFDVATYMHFILLRRLPQ